MENEICGNSSECFLPILHISLSYKIRTRCFSILRHFSGAYYYVQIQQTNKFGNSDKRFLPILHVYKQKLPKFDKSFLFILRDLFFHKNLAFLACLHFKVFSGTSFSFIINLSKQNSRKFRQTFLTY